MPDMQGTVYDTCPNEDFKSDDLEPKNDILQPKSNGLQPKSDCFGLVAV